MQSWIEPLGWMLVHSVWLIVVIVGLTAVALNVLRRRSSNARYLVGCAALWLSVSVLPSVFAWVATHSQATLEPIVVSETQTTVNVGDAIELEGSGEKLGVDAESGFVEQQVPFKVTQFQTAGGHRVIDVDVVRSAEESEQRPPVELTTWQRLEAQVRPHLMWLVSGWLIGVCLLSLRPLIGWRAAWRLRRVGVSAVPDSVSEMLRRLAERLQVRRAVAVFQSSLVHIPCVVGAIKPVILLPASALIGLSPEQLEAVLAHVRRHDFLVNALQTVIETLLFYHPAIWWLSRRVRQEREHCCDDVAVSIGGDVAVYARMLMSIEQLRGTSTQVSVAANGGSLVERIRRLLPAPAEQARSPWLAVTVMLVSLAILVGSWQWTMGQVSNLPINKVADTEAVPNVATQTQGAGQVENLPHAGWPQWGRTSHRNNVAEGQLPLEWNLGKGTNIVWTAKLGSETYSSPIVSGGKVFIGTNNAGELNPAHPKGKDLSCLACFDEATGKLLWQYASEKLPAGRSFDWPNLGLCSTACADGDRVWVVTNRCEVVCLDANGFRDGENDGPCRDETAQTEMDADVIWKFDMFGELGVRPLHQAASSITNVDGVLLLNTSNGPDESYQKAAAPHAANFLALDATTGRVIWKDNSAGESIVVGGSSCMCSGASPAVATLGGVRQAIFTGKEGWVYGYDFDDLKLGKTTLLWKFDCNPKTSIYMLGGRSRRHPLVASPIVADSRVYVATGRNPEHGEGEADLWCIDPTKRGDLSPELVFNKSFENGEQPIPQKALRACETDKGDFVRPNPNSGVIWHYGQADRNGNGKIEFEESFHCTMGSPVIHDGLLFIADFSGTMHCLDSMTGELQWTHDLFAAVYATCVVADGQVLIGDEDGDVAIFNAARTKQPVHGDEASSFGGPIYSTPVIVNDTLFVATKNTLVAIRDPKLGVKPMPAPTTGSWTSFRHDLAQTGVSSSPLPDKLELLWEASLGEQVVGTAAIVGDHVYVPCLSGELVCLDRKSGRKLWAYRSVGELRPNTFRPGFNSSPTVSADAVYLGDEDGMFHAIDRTTSKPRWTFKTDGEIFSSAAVVNGKVLFGSYDSHLYCLNETDGTLAWKFATQGKVHCAPAVIDGLVLIAGCDEHLRAIEIATGTEKKDISLGSYLIASPAIVGDVAYVETYGSEVLAVNRTSREIVWRYSAGNGDFPFHSSAAVTDKLVILGGHDKFVHGIDRAIGKALWTIATRGRIESSPVVVGQRVFIGSNDGNIYELDATTGAERWKFNLGKPISASPAIGEGVLVIGSKSNDGRVVCFGDARDVPAND